MGTRAKQKTGRHLAFSIQQHRAPFFSFFSPSAPHKTTRRLTTQTLFASSDCIGGGVRITPPPFFFLQYRLSQLRRTLLEGLSWSFRWRCYLTISVSAAILAKLHCHQQGSIVGRWGGAGGGNDQNSKLFIFFHASLSADIAVADNALMTRTWRLGVANACKGVMQRIVAGSPPVYF